MKRTPQNDLRYIKTERLIQETFKNMLLEMDYAQISIKELTERAMINRKTFYLHYNSLDELLGKLQVELYMEMMESLSDITLPQDLEQLVRTLFPFWANADGVNEKILRSQGNFPIGKSPGEYVWKKIFHRFGPNSACSNCTADELCVAEVFLSGSFASIFMHWVASDRKIPLEEIMQLTVKLISQGLRALEET